MNIEQANTISLPEILKKLGYSTAKEDGVNLMYLSPLRNEKTPSFHVNTKKNSWYDHGCGEGGNPLDFVIAYLASQGEDNTPHDALRWFTVMFKDCNDVKIVPETRPIVSEQTLRVKKISQLQHPALVNYLQSRGIPLPGAKRYLKEVDVLNTKSGKTFFAIGLKNEDDGFEIRNGSFQGSVRSKYISLIRGSNPECKAIHVFEGFMDFLSALVQEKKAQLEEDVLILNSLSLLGKAYPYINNYGYEKLYSWLDNDPAGKNASHLLQSYLEKYSTIQFIPMNKLYEGFKDVNEWLINQKKLKAITKKPKKG